MVYGYFEDTELEYVIMNPKTPAKWINYVGDLSFGGFIDHTGGSCICLQDPALGRIVRYSTQGPASELRGETLYLRITTPDGAQDIYSPYYVPTLNNLDSFACRVGCGYNRYLAEYRGIRSDITVFIPRGSTTLIRDIRIQNNGSLPVRVEVIPYVEYSHFDALKQITNGDWVPQTMQSRAETLNGITVLLQYAFMKKDTQVNYLTASIEASSFESERRFFLGENGYGTYQHPLSLDHEELGNHEASCGDNIGALLFHLGVLNPGEEKRLITQLGCIPSLYGGERQIDRYRDPSLVDEAFSDLKDFWKSYLSRFQVKTPDQMTNTMLNIHNPRQCYITKTWSRYLSLYQLGYGKDRGIGFRDSCQDVMGILPNAADEARSFLTSILSVQKKDGSAMHQYNPLTMEGNAGDSAEYEDRPSYYSDDHLWAVLAVTAYIKETGKTDILEEAVPFYEKTRDGTPEESGSIYEHLRRAVGFTARHTGAHGLPLLGFADWNDTVNLPRGAESVFTACLYGKALLELEALAEVIGSHNDASDYRRLYLEMKERVENSAWDGDWYVRYFDNEGRPLGSKANSAGRIYANAQSWAVLSGFASATRSEKALESVFSILNTTNGIKLSHPGYNGYDRNQGGITTYPPGAKENGGIFLHANPWMMIAETYRGNGDRAYLYYCQLNPVRKNEHIDEYYCEPYCYPQNILGNEHPLFGKAANSWLSGTASWMYQAATQFILGVRPEYSGLRIAPCIPRGWKEFSVQRSFRNSLYDIRVQNPHGLSQGVTRLRVDGMYREGNIAPFWGDGREHRIEAVIGE